MVSCAMLMRQQLYNDSLDFEMLVLCVIALKSIVGKGCSDDHIVDNKLNAR